MLRQAILFRAFRAGGSSVNSTLPPPLKDPAVAQGAHRGEDRAPAAGGQAPKGPRCRREATLGLSWALDERCPDHRHRNLKAFEEHVRAQVSYCFIAESYLSRLFWVRGYCGPETVHYGHLFDRTLGVT